MNRPEVLAPAGDMQSLIAAVTCGADAVYLGAGTFNARQNAHNFEGDSLEKAVRYCHARDVKVYLTLNTIIRQDEMHDALKLAKHASQLGIDAIILQDIGLAQHIRKAAPALSLHASTQMSCHTPNGVRQLVKAGFKRVVLAREMTKDEIQQCVGLGAEIEVFVHGALCVSVSGTCLMSAALGGRSGNRGLCAQPCRLPFTTKNTKANSDQTALSLKDLSLLDSVGELVEMGVDSLKIEGRMKRPEYVAAATTAYSKAVKSMAPSWEIKQALQDVYSRSGFTDGYFTGKRKDMIGTRSKEDVLAGMNVVDSLANLYKDEAQTIPVDFEFTLQIDRPAIIKATDNRENTVTISGKNGERAIKRALDEKRVEQQLEKTGGTPFYVNKIKVNLQPGSTIQISAINSLRRQAIEQLLLLREQTEEIIFDESLIDKLQTPKNIIPQIKQKDDNKKIVARCQNINQANSVNAEFVIVPLDSSQSQLALLQKTKQIAVEIPTEMFGVEDKLSIQLDNAKAAGVKYALCNNIAAVYLCNEKEIVPISGWGLHVCNDISLDYWKSQNIGAAILSPELAFHHMDFATNKAIPTGMFAYGAMPLMVLRNCPLRKDGKCGNCPGQGVLTDRMGISFPVSCGGRKIASTLYNSVPTYLADKLNEIPNVDFLLLYFTNESPEQVYQIENEYNSGGQAPESFTRSMYRQGSI